MVASTAGDLGDAVVLLGILSELPDAPHTILLDPDGKTKMRSDGDCARVHALLKDLFLSQPYIKEFRPKLRTDRVDWRSAGFRNGHHRRFRTLMESHVSHLTTTLGIGHGISGQRAWLDVEPSPITKDNIVINRTDRYQNISFPWKQIVEHYSHRLIFIGTESEHRNFCQEFGNVGYIKTQNLMEAARLIKGSPLYIGNQSVGNAIAEGLKHPLIQETSVSIPDCIWHRSNAQYVHNGGCTLPDICGSGALTIDPVVPTTYKTNPNVSPPGGWWYGGKFVSLGFTAAVGRVLRQPDNRGMSEEDAKELILGENFDRNPEWFERQAKGVFGTVDAARTNAKRAASSLTPVLKNP